MATLLGSARLVTLLGPGGVGKTRVALAAAASAARCHRDGACFVDLTKVRDAELVPELIAAELGVNSDTSSDARGLIAEILRGLQVLLVIDNVEHVITAAPFIAEILAVSDSVTVLATSRERLGLAAEHVVDVDPLRVDDPDGAHQSPCPSARR